jgi:hypothetical protein
MEPVYHECRAGSRGLYARERRCVGILEMGERIGRHVFGRLGGIESFDCVGIRCAEIMLIGRVYVHRLSGRGHLTDDLIESQ